MLKYFPKFFMPDRFQKLHLEICESMVILHLHITFSFVALMVFLCLLSSYNSTPKFTSDLFHVLIKILI